MYFGVDVGRGFVKTTAGGEVLKFPSYLCPARELDIESGQGEDLEHLRIEINGQEHFAGELAKKHGGSREFQKEKIGHRNTIPLLITALSYLIDGKYCQPKAVVGLPISDYSNQGRAFERKAAGNYEVEIYGKKVYIEIIDENILSFPEGAGVIWNRLLNSQGEIIRGKEQRIAVIDIGWKTCNFCVLDELSYVDSLSGTVPLGLSKAFKPFYKRLAREKDILPAAAESLIAKEGKKELRELAQEITDQLNMWWSGAGGFDFILIAGGGGNLIFKYLDFENMKRVKNPQEANCRGFYKVGRSQL